MHPVKLEAWHNPKLTTDLNPKMDRRSHPRQPLFQVKHQWHKRALKSSRMESRQEHLLDKRNQVHSTMPESHQRRQCL